MLGVHMQTLSGIVRNFISWLYILVILPLMNELPSCKGAIVVAGGSHAVT
jgi:hypothetical protein